MQHFNHFQKHLKPFTDFCFHLSFDSPRATNPNELLCGRTLVSYFRFQQIATNLQNYQMT